MVQEETMRRLESTSDTKHDSTFLVLVSLYDLQTDFVSAHDLHRKTSRPIYIYVRGDNRLKLSTQSTISTLPLHLLFILQTIVPSSVL
jgi:hypothetical protein